MAPRIEEGGTGVNGDDGGETGVDGGRLWRGAR